jgi:hypothetical protein
MTPKAAVAYARSQYTFYRYKSTEPTDLALAWRVYVAAVVFLLLL